MSEVVENRDAVSSEEPESEEEAPPVENETVEAEPLAAEPDDGVDEITAAIEGATESVGADEATAGSESVAEGETVAEPEAAAETETTAEKVVRSGDDEPLDLVLPQSSTVPLWPFAAYDVVWLLFAGVLVWQFSQLPGTVAVFDSTLYPLAVLGGLALAVAGPILILAVWIGSWGKSTAGKGALFVSSLLRGAVATLVGVVLWWGALLLLDSLRFGRLL